MFSKIAQYLIIFSIGVIILASWMHLISPELKNADQNFELRLETLEHWQIRESLESDKFEDQFAKGEIKIEVLENMGNQLEIKYSEISADIITNEIYWEVEKTTLVDKTTRQSLETDSYFIFPLNTKKQDYDYGFFGDRPHEFSFVNAEKLNGLEIYYFMATNVYDISGAYDKFPDAKIYANQTSTYLVEPITGQIVGYNTFWQDFIEGPDEKTVISNGNAQTSQYSKDILVQNASNLSSLYQIYDAVIPIIIILGILITEGFFVMFHILEKRKSEIKTSKLIAIGELSARFAHDIRNPLSNINLALNSIKKDESTLNEKTQEKLDIISKNVGRISHQVDDVLDFIRMHPLKKEHLSLKSLIRESIEALTIPKTIKIVTPTKDFQIWGDSFQLQIVCKNLINNAIQSIGKKEGTITIRRKEDTKNVFLEFEDSGPGFSDIDKKKIFELLTTTKQTGTGLGLVSCKQIIENHGGSISVKENPTTFTVRIPKK